MKAIGIDLGTTYSCVGLFSNGKVDILPNDQGNRITPSVVFMDGDTKEVGEPAEAKTAKSPMNTFYDVKRMIGRSWEDPVLQKEIRNGTWPFEVCKAPSGSGFVPKIKAPWKNAEGFKMLTPEEISSHILTKMCEVATASVGSRMTDCVVTVPAYFNDAQRQATKDAGKIAGLNILRIVNEPTAAALAYGLDKKNKEQTVLVYDLGGGTFDLSIIQMEGGIFEVKATCGDTHLGGRDFDILICDYCVEKFRSQTGKDISQDPRAMAKVRRQVERAKRSLSSSCQTTIDVDGVAGNMDMMMTVSRARFNELCEPLFQQTMKKVDEALQDAKISADQVDVVLCVGGSTRILRVQELLQARFGKPPCCSIHPDEAVAYGAAIQAAVLVGDQDESVKDVLLLDVVALSLGVEVRGGMFQPIVNKNTPVPCTRKNTFSTVEANQKVVEIKIYEGVRQRTRDCRLLGTFTVDNLEPVKDGGFPQIDIEFSLDQNSCLVCTAHDVKTGRVVRHKIEKTKETLSPEEIERMHQEASKYAEQDRIFKEKTEKRCQVESLSYNLKAMKEKNKSSLTEDDLSLCDRCIDDAKNVCEADVDSVTLEELDKKCNFLQQNMDTIRQKCGGGDDGTADAAAAAAAAGFGGAPSGATAAPGPTVEEVD